MPLERLWSSRPIKVRKEKEPAERIDSLLGLIGVTIRIKGVIDLVHKLIMFAVYRHTSQGDAPSVAHGNYQAGLTNPTPVSKGNYWNEDEANAHHNKLIRKYFPHYYLTPTDEEREADPSLSAVTILTEKVRKDVEAEIATQIIYFPEGSRNTKDGKIKSGAFALSANLMFTYGIEVPIQPVLIENMPPILMNGPINAKSILQLVWWRVIHNPRGNHEVTLTYMPIISPREMMASATFESSHELAGAMMLAYIAALGTHYVPNSIPPPTP